MAYPTHNQLRSSRFVSEPGQIVDVSQAGEASARNPFRGNDPGVFELHHRLSTTNKEALETDYDNQRESTFSMTWQETGETFTVFYLQKPQAVQEGPDLWFVVSLLAKVLTPGFLLKEDGDSLLKEDGDKLIQEAV